MPYTPLQLGSGRVTRSISLTSFSLMVFAWSHILMDLQPLLSVFTGIVNLHGFSHTPTGALCIVVFASLTGKALADDVLVFLSRDLTINQQLILDIPTNVTYQTALISAVIGVYSHILLDNIMHVDIESTYSFVSDSALISVITYSNIHKFCIYIGLLGAALLFLIKLKLSIHGRIRLHP